MRNKPGKKNWFKSRLNWIELSNLEDQRFQRDQDEMGLDWLRSVLPDHIEECEMKY